MNSFFGKVFGFDNQKHSVRTEIVAGITTFLTMAYILAVNPGIFSALPGMPKGSVFTATALAAIVGTLMMALYAKKPFALAPGMGLNAFFVFTVCLGMGYSWQFALTAVLIEGLIFIIMSITGLRGWLLGAIPGTLKKAIGAGIGLFIAFIGMQNAGIIVNNDATLVSLGDITKGTALLSLIGFAITAGLVMLKVKGGMLIGILATTLLGLVIKDPATGESITSFIRNDAGRVMLVSLPESVGPIFCKFEWASILSWDMLVVVLTFLFIDLFDTMGTIIGVCQGTELGNKENVEGIDKMFLSDSVATVVGACLGTSTTTTYVESASGVSAGGRTGLTAFSTAVCFALALFFSPIFLAIPGAATAPALIMVGFFMMSPASKINWEDPVDGISAFLTIAFMTLSYSISNGIMFGILAWVIGKIVTKKTKDITVPTIVIAIIFLIYLILK